MYDEAVDSVTLKIWVICKQCNAPYAHPRSEGQGTGTILKHKRVHERHNEKAAQKIDMTSDIRIMLESHSSKVRLTQEEYDIKCLNAMVACNCSFEQFNVGPFRELLDIGHGFEIPTPKIIKTRLKKYAKLAQKEIKQ